MTSVSPAITPPVKPTCALKTQTRVLPFLPAVSEVSSQLNPWTNCWWSSVTSLWRARNYPSGWPVAYVCPCLGTCCNAVSLQWCCWSWSWSVRHWGETLRWLTDSKTTRAKLQWVACRVEPELKRGVITFEGLKLTFLALPCSSPETAGWLLNPCFTFSAVNSSWNKHAFQCIMKEN